ncbi:MAG: YIP1 family protein [Burkholderiales bacterium]|nr:YIP1 family protein [Burkholderiales bacterium]
MGLLRRLLWLIVSPRDAWDAIAEEPIGIDALITRYIVPLSLLAPIATVVGMKTFDRDWDPASGYLVPADEIYAAGSVTLFGTILSIFALAGIFRLIAPMYGSSRDFRAALKVATFGAIPVLLASAALVVPVMVAVPVVALCHTLYLYWVGVGRVLHVAPGAQTEFIGISVTLLGGASTLGGGLASSVGLF